jgi:regulator of sirC expression with transglutaminase-like and TPR domain
MVGVNFPGHFLLRVPGTDHLLDPCGGRRLYPTIAANCCNANTAPISLQAEHLHTATPRAILQRLSRNLRQLHLSNDNPLAALVDAERVLELGNASAADYLARASLYQRLDCPNAERFDLEHAAAQRRPDPAPAPDRATGAPAAQFSGALGPRPTPVCRAGWPDGP